MDAQQFLAEFGHIANAPGGVVKLRELILSLAVTGRLVAQSSEDQPASEWLQACDQMKAKLAAEKKISKPMQLADIAPAEMPFVPPPGWSFARLGRFTAKMGSGSTPRGGSQAYVNKGIPFLRSQNVWNDGVRLDDVAYITPEINQDMGGTIVQAHDLLLNITGASLGRCAVVPTNFGPANVSQHVTIIRLVDPTARHYLHICLLSPLLQKMIWGRQVGMAREGLSKKVLEQFEIPLPPVKEQSRIVAKVDELMALCDTLEAQQQARRKLQNNLRQSTLQAVASATSPHELQTTWARLADNFGRLFHAPEDLIDLDQCIKQLALKGLLSVRAESEMVNAEIAELTRTSTAFVPDSEMDWTIPNHWVWARCAWLGEARLGKMLDAAKNKGDFRPYLRNINVRWGKFDLSNVLQMRIEEHELSKVSVRKGDLVICEGGEPGRAAVWSGEEAFVIQKALHRFRCNEHVLPEYILFCLEHDYFSGRLSRYFTGATIKHLTGRALAEYPIPLPPVDEQKRILVAANELMHSVATLKERLIAGNRCAAALAATSVASLTGIAIETEEEPMKAPQTELVAPLRLGAAPEIKALAPLATILAHHHGEMSAKDLWQRFGGEIDTFYAQLKTEVAHGWILEPTPAEMREKPADAVSA